MDKRVVVCAALATAGLFGPRAAAAQTFETVGIRAQGMGGAFVAMADDATATWWNPAGIATGPMFSAVWERGSTTDPGEEFGAGPAWRGDSSAFAMTFPAMGLSYYRLRVSDIQPAAEGDGIDLRTFTTGQYGLTVGQSVGGALVIASTLKLVRAGRMAGTADAASGGDPGLEAATELETDAETSTGLDVGAMVKVGYARVGVTVRNLREPEFGEGEDEFKLERQARAGFALLGGRLGFIDGASASIDTDLTTTDTVLGETQHLAVGGEAWMFGRRVGLRGGFSHNMAGQERNAMSAGISLTPQQGFHLDGVLTFGSDEARRGWGIGGRVTF